MLQAAGHRVLVFRAGENEVGIDSEPLQTLPHDVLEQLTSALSTDRVTVENSYARGADRPRLQDRTALLNDVGNCLQLVFGDCERGALDGSDALARHGITEIQRGGDHHAGRAV